MTEFVGRQWLDHHIETVIRPKLGYVPTIAAHSETADTWGPRYVKALQACWKEGKKRCGRAPMLLTGRDTWLYELLARLEGYPTTFRPEISTEVSKHIGTNHPHHGSVMLDTGFKGTVPRAMGISDFWMVCYDPPFGVVDYMSKAYYDLKATHQLFPYVKVGPLSGLAGMMEGWSKYWTHGRVVNGAIVQTVSDVYNFMRAAKQTIYIANQVCPAPKIGRVFVRSVGRGV